MKKPMTDMTDAELAALGWDFATRDTHGGLVSVASADYGDLVSQRKEALKELRKEALKELRTFIDLRPLAEPPTVPAPIHKACWTCDTPKPVTAFHWRNRARGVRHSSCKACRCEDERERYDGRNFLRECAARFGPRPLPAIAPTNPPLPWGYGMTPEDVAAIDEAAEGARHIPATTPASVVDPADACVDLDPMGDGSAWGWVTVATVGALVALVAIVV